MSEVVDAREVVPIGLDAGPGLIQKETSALAVYTGCININTPEKIDA